MAFKTYCLTCYSLYRVGKGRSMLQQEICYPAQHSTHTHTCWSGYFLFTEQMDTQFMSHLVITEIWWSYSEVLWMVVMSKALDTPS